MLERMVVQRERQRDRACLISARVESDEGPGVPAGVDISEPLGGRSKEEEKRVMCVRV
jgi:hypothetical protein